MKAGLFALPLVGLAAAAPSAHRRHEHLHEKRDVIVTEIDYVTQSLPDVLVYVDASGNTMSVVTAGSGTVATSAAAAAGTQVVTEPAASAASPTSTSVYVAPSSSAAASSSQVARSSVASASSSAAAASSSSSSSSSGYGISYSPYNNDGSCKSQSEVNDDFESLSGYSVVRTYGTDCDQTTTVLNAAVNKGMKVMFGVYDITETSSSIQTMIDSVNSAGGDWSNVHTVSIGNEGVNDGTYSVSDVVAQVSAARTQLSAAGYSGNVVTIDTFVAIIANPELCEASDYAAANAHAFFDGSVEAADAGTWLVEQMQRVSSACGGKNTWIVESGWPSYSTTGEHNGVAYASQANQDAAISSIKSAVSSQVILFSAYNDYWKSDNSGTYGCEKYWGIYGNAPSS